MVRHGVQVEVELSLFFKQGNIYRVILLSTAVIRSWHRYASKLHACVGVCIPLSDMMILSSTNVSCADFKNIWHPEGGTGDPGC